MQQEEIEHVEEVEQQSQAEQIQNATVCLDESSIIEQDEEEIEEEIQEEEVDDGVFTLELSEGSDCEDKEYLGKLRRDKSFIYFLLYTQNFNIEKFNIISIL